MASGRLSPRAANSRLYNEYARRPDVRQGAANRVASSAVVSRSYLLQSESIPAELRRDGELTSLV